jgi:hypothetical protein
MVSTNGERWLISDGESANGTVASIFSVTTKYNHEYYLSVKSTVLDGALTSPQSGWYADGSLASISVSAAEGYKFEKWIGYGLNSYTGSSESAAVTINSPINETAEIYVGLTITAANDGSVSYIYGCLRGEVSAGASRTIYVPSGAHVFIKASPSSFLYEFSSWKGDAISSVDGTLYVVVNSPSTISGNFRWDISILAMLALLVIGMGTVILVGIKRKMRC